MTPWQAMSAPEAALRLSHIAYPVTALGPGKRVALWVSGCSLRCRNCITPELLDPRSGSSVTVRRVAARILDLPIPLEGVTLTGGEPFDQASALASVMDIIRVLRPEWSVLAFSGYPLDVLRKRGQPERRLLAHCDILVAGPYVASLPARHPLAASSNQQVHYLSARGRALGPRCDKLPFDRADLGLSRSGRDWLIGILSPHARSRIHDGLELDTLTPTLSLKGEGVARGCPLPPGEGQGEGGGAGESPRR